MLLSLVRVYTHSRQRQLILENMVKYLLEKVKLRSLLRVAFLVFMFLVPPFWFSFQKLGFAQKLGFYAAKLTLEFATPS